MTSADLSVLQPYCENDMQLLKKISRSIFLRFNEPLTKADHDDFYSIANMTLWQAYNAYDPDMGISFDGFLRSCLQKKFKSELTHRHRQKRILNQFAVSLDAASDSEESCKLLELIPSDFDTFEEVTKRYENQQYQDKVQLYISRLSNLQVNILNLLINGYRTNEIREILHLSSKELTENLQIMRSFENVKILF
ncbi:sigma factor [Phocaeicola sartorii]|uniref:sigma factor n=1 Tax=Phocaeicola sartorii TaxID=671267 RepID=UPI0025940406|nr:sigma factor [Phocaeicola sartorii]